jgi:hypothetical protein
MRQEDQLIQKLEHENFIVGKRRDGIYHVYLKDGTLLDLKLQSEMVYYYDEITQGIPGLFIFEAGHACSVTKQARDNAILIEEFTPIKSSVVFVQNQVYKMIAAFFYRKNRPKQPYLIVSNFDDGIDWLLSMKEEKAEKSVKKKALSR